MNDKINNIAKIFNSTFLLYSMLDTTMEQSSYLHIPNEDRRMMKALYKLYNMKRYTLTFDVFEGMVLNHSLNRNMIPILAAEELCLKSNKE
jgi:hypothetical protein